MKRVIAVLFVVAFAFTMVSGCASVQEVKKLQADTQAALDRAQRLLNKSVLPTLRPPPPALAALRTPPTRPKLWPTSANRFS